VKPRAYNGTFTTYGSEVWVETQFYQLMSMNPSGSIWVKTNELNSWRFNRDFSFLNDPTDDIVVQSKLIDKVTNNLLAKLRDSDLNLAQAYAERKQTANTLVSSAKTVAKALGSLKKGNFAGAAKALGLTKPPKRAKRRFGKAYSQGLSPSATADAVSDAWLSLQYGWKPLLQDVYGAAVTLAKTNLAGENPNTIYAVATSGSSRKFEQRKRVNSTVPSDASGIDSMMQTMKASIQCRMSVTYERSSPIPKSLASLGITNPALLAWELVPYSFVVDWFFPVGQWFQGLDATSGLTFVSGYRTIFRKYRADVIYETSIVYNGRPHSYSRKGGQAWQTKTFVARTTLGGFPSAPYPSFKNPLSASHVTSALALLNQLKR
jgi:hypothetical protein